MKDKKTKPVTLRIDQWIIDEVEGMAEAMGLDRAVIFRTILGAGVRALANASTLPAPLEFEVRSTENPALPAPLPPPPRGKSALGDPPPPNTKN